MSVKEKIKLSLSNEIIDFIDFGERITSSRSLWEFYNHELIVHHKILKQEKKERERLKRRFKNAISYLKNAKFITQAKTSKGIAYKLTEKGQLRKAEIMTLKYAQQNGQIKKRKFPHLILFDIPEKYTRIRYLLRKNLKNLDYELVQKSCFYSNDQAAYKITREIIKKSKIKEYIKIYKIDKELL